MEMHYNSNNSINATVVLRPDRDINDPMRYASYINIEQPEAIKYHPNFIK